MMILEKETKRLLLVVTIVLVWATAVLQLTQSAHHSDQQVWLDLESPQTKASDGGRKLQTRNGIPIASTTTSIPRRDSRDATVMAMAQGYDKKTHQRFVGSLRKSGFAGHILLAVEPNMQEGVEDYLLSNNVTLLKLNYTDCTNPIYTHEELSQYNRKKAKEANTCIQPYPELKIRWSRFPFLRDALQACEACTGPVLVCDARDVFFQRDPFGRGAPEVDGLQFFAESRFVDAKHPFIAERVANCKEGFKMRGPMLCSGTTVGTREAILSYLKTMHQEFQLWMSRPQCLFKEMGHGGDQAVMNYLYYSRQFDNLQPQVFMPRMGLVNTVGYTAQQIHRSHKSDGMKLMGLSEKEAVERPFSGSDMVNGGRTRWLGIHFELIDGKGFFLDRGGERSRIVHQWDRFGHNIELWMRRMEGVLYD